MTDQPSHPMTIDNKPVTTGKTRAVIDPGTGETVGHAPLGSSADLDAAVSAARAAYPGWAATPDAERQEACRKMAGVLTDNAPELAALLSREQGKPQKGMNAEFELGGCAGWMGYTAELEIPVTVLQDDDAARVEKHHVPIGVIGSILPWNWPLMIAIWHLAPAIRAGNTVVVKPSEGTTLCTLRMIELLAEVLPAGVLNVVAEGENIGQAMSSHPGIDKIVFTGSTGTGKKIMEAAAPTLKKLTLEMGGNDAGIVLPDADPAALAQGLFWGAFINTGQTCAALKRLYVHDSIYDAVCDALVAVAKDTPMGDWRDEANVLGPLQNEAQFEIVSSLAEKAKADGARILTGGEAMDRTGYFYPITLIADADETMDCVKVEQFGPLLPIIRYTDIADAIRQANALEADLSASVWSADIDAAMEIAQQMVAGTVFINKHGEVAPHIPFGGARWSSIGVEFGLEGLLANTNTKIYNIAKG